MQAMLYHLHHIDYQEDIPFWIQQARGLNPILELGCGTGRLTRPLLKSGHTYFGLDHDLHMLEVLQHQVPDFDENDRERLFIIQGDMRSLPVLPGFGAVVLPCNTLSSFCMTDCRIIFQQSYRVLSRNGALIFSIPNPLRMKNLQEKLLDDPDLGRVSQEGNFIHPYTGNPVQVSSGLEGDSEGVRWVWHYDHLLPDGTVHRETQATFHFVLPIDTYRDLLQEAGFQILHHWGDFKQGDVRPDSSYWIVRAEAG